MYNKVESLQLPRYHVHSNMGRAFKCSQAWRQQRSGPATASTPTDFNNLSLSLLPSLCKNRDFPSLFFCRIDELAPSDAGKCWCNITKKKKRHPSCQLADSNILKTEIKNKERNKGWLVVTTWQPADCFKSHEFSNSLSCRWRRALCWAWASEMTQKI